MTFKGRYKSTSTRNRLPGKCQAMTAALARELIDEATGETEIHIAIVQMIRLFAVSGLKFWHTPNGGKRSKREAAKLKTMGVLPGVPDISIMLPDGSHAYIEVKSRVGRMTKEQKEFFAACHERNIPIALVRTVEQAHEFLAGLGALRFDPSK